MLVDLTPSPALVLVSMSGDDAGVVFGFWCALRCWRAGARAGPFLICDVGVTRRFVLFPFGRGPGALPSGSTRRQGFVVDKHGQVVAWLDDGVRRDLVTQPGTVVSCTVVSCTIVVQPALLVTFFPRIPIPLRCCALEFACHALVGCAAEWIVLFV